MDAIRTLLLERTLTVVLDPDRVANASTRPIRDAEIERFEDELAQLGFVMSLDLAITIRRLPQGAIHDLRRWMVDTLAKQLGAPRPQVPLTPAFPTSTQGDGASVYLRRVLAWLATRPEQPCPWCGQIKTIGALDPCGHLVCRACWGGGNYVGCPICHRRVAVGEPFVRPPDALPRERVTHHDGELKLVHLGFDLVGAARERFARILARTTPLAPDDRAEIEVVIDAIGPKVVLWLPSKIPVRETAAITLARLWTVGPDRSAMVRATHGYLMSATDVLRVAAVLMGGNPELVEPMTLRSISRSMRRAILEALDRLPAEHVVEEVRRQPGLWKRVGERLHPYEWAERFTNAALAFAVVRETAIAGTSFYDILRKRASTIPSLRVNTTLRVEAWAGPVEDALRLGDPATALERLAQRPAELLRRADHVVRVTQRRQPDLLGATLAAIQHAIPLGTPSALLVLASHVSRRGARWPRRVWMAHGDVLRAWGTDDRRPPLRSDTIGAIVGTVRSELVARAMQRRAFARAVIDRGLGDLVAPLGGRVSSRARIESPGSAGARSGAERRGDAIEWPRGSDVALPDGGELRLVADADVPLAVELFDASWRHVETVAGSRHVDLHLERLHAQGARHAMIVVGRNRAAFEVGVAAADTGTIVHRFELRGRAAMTVPLAIDLEARRLRWLDVRFRNRDALRRVGGYRAALAHLGHDVASLYGAHARPTLWDVAAIHAAARANIVYVRERDGSITTYRRREGEPAIARLHRLLSGASEDGRLGAIPAANAPTWLAVLRDDFAIPTGSAGYILDSRARGGDGIERLAAADLVAELAAK